MVKVRVYSTRTCQYCRLLKAFLEKNNVKYETIDVTTDVKAAQEMVEISGQYGVPVTVVDDEVIIGFRSERFNELFGGGRGTGDYDVIIIGGGPAGLTAAMYAARKMLRGIIITENIGGQAVESWSIENYMGYRMITGGELMNKFEEQVRKEDIQIELDNVASIEKQENGFLLHTASDRAFKSKCLIITTGAKPRWLGLKDEEKYIGHGESICSTCDGPLFRDKNVAIVGGGNYALTTAIEMSKIAKEVHLIVRSNIRADDIYKEQYKNLKNIHTHQNYLITALGGDKFLQSITISERDTGETLQIPVEGLFLAIGHEPNTAFLDGLVEMNPHGEIIIDKNCCTSAKGVFAAGDATNINGKQVIIAAGEGAKAALEAHTYLMKQ